jgi:tetratricopeptide (TPR) repeat protein
LDETVEETMTERPGTRIGSYKLFQQIGEGGMGRQRLLPLSLMGKWFIPFNRGIAMRAPSSASEPPVSAGWWGRLISRRTPAAGRPLKKLLVLLVLVGLTSVAGVWVRPHVRAWYHRRAARTESQHYHNRQAIRHLLICRETWPHDPETLLLSARAARRAQVYGDSERLLRMYQEVRGRDDAHTFELLLLAAERRVDEVAIQCWRYVEEGRYDAPLLMEALTRGYLRQYRIGQARDCLDRWKQTQPNNPQAFYVEGLYLLDYLHSHSAAVESYRRAVELDADHEEARLGLAVALLMGKSFTEAAEHFQRLRQCQPDNRRVQVGMAECLDGLGQTTEAVRLVDDVLAGQPEFAPALSLRGQLALNSGQLPEAAAWLRQALRHNPRDHRARYSLVLCLQKSGQEEEARQEGQQLQQREQDLARFNEIVTKEIAQRPTDPALHCTLGQILLRGGQEEEGLRWLQSALQLDPRYPPARQALEEYGQKAKPESRHADAGQE